MPSIIRTLLEQKLIFWLAAGLTGVVLYLAISSVRAYWRLRHFKGPPLAAWSFLWFCRAAVSGQSHLRLSEVNTKYGPLARIGPNTLVTCDEELYRRMNARNTAYTKPSFYKAWRMGSKKNTLISETDPDTHYKLRKQLSPGYSGKDNLYLEPDMDKVIWSLVRSWEARYVSKGDVLKPMNMARQLQYFTLDLITSLSFGQPLGYIDADADLYEYIETTHNSFPAMYFCAAVPWINQLLGIHWIQDLMSPSMKDRIGVGKLKAVCNEVIARRFAEVRAQTEKGDGTRVKSDMTGSFIAHGMSQDEITDNAILNIFAGSDTTATVLRGAFLSIVTQPRIVRALVAEADSAEVPSDRVITHAQAVELPYLQACVKESIRCTTSAGGLLPRLVPPSGDYYKGQFIPGGTIIGHCAWNLQRRNFDAYGSDADLFRPERWIEATEAARAGDSARLNRMESCFELAFSTGRYKCLGYQVALMELGKVLFELFRRFDFGFMDGFCTLESNECYGLFLQKGMWMRVEKR